MMDTTASRYQKVQDKAKSLYPITVGTPGNVKRMLRQFSFVQGANHYRTLTEEEWVNEQERVAKAMVAGLSNGDDTMWGNLTYVEHSRYKAEAVAAMRALGFQKVGETSAQTDGA